LAVNTLEFSGRERKQCQALAAAGFHVSGPVALN
jgi:hypothetical protein